MHNSIFINGVSRNSYSLFNDLGIYVTLISSIFLICIKSKSIGLYSRYAIFCVTKKNVTAGQILKYFLAFIELILLTVISIATALCNYPFGDLVGTGANYFGCLFSFAILGVVFSVLIMANPMEQMDMAAFLLPIRLFFAKIACLLQGCCGGKLWKYGPYFEYPYNPGNRVPVQGIEAFWAIAIFIFLLWYRKNAKKGTLFPIYMILYCSTRFFSEFLKANEEDILTYQILCVIGFVVGLIWFFIAKIYGNRICLFIDKRHAKLDIKSAELESRIQDDLDRRTKEKSRNREDKRKRKEREKRNKKLYSHSRKL